MRKTKCLEISTYTVADSTLLYYDRSRLFWTPSLSLKEKLSVSHVRTRAHMLYDIYEYSYKYCGTVVQRSKAPRSTTQLCTRRQLVVSSKSSRTRITRRLKYIKSKSSILVMHILYCVC